MESRAISYPEVAATADFLMTIQSVAPLFCRVIQSNINEQKTGADFEWWVGSGALWLGLRVQAKRHYRKHTAHGSDYYGDLGQSNNNGRQVDLLLNDCQARGRVPLHMFFESITNAKPSRIGRCKSALSAELWGTSIADSVEVEKIVSANTLTGADVRKLIQPASCLAACPGNAGALVDRVMNTIRNHVWSTDREDVTFPEPGELPGYVLSALEGDLNVVPDLPFGLDAILVMSDDPIFELT